MRRDRVERVFRTGDGRIRVGWRLLLFVAAFALALLLGQLAVALALGGAGPSGAGAVAGSPTPGEMAVGGATVLFAALAAGSVTLALDDRGTDALGFYLRPEAVGEGFRGLGIGAGAALVGVAAIASAGGLRTLPDAGSGAEWLVEGGWALLLFALPAAAEEALFRGYPLQAVAESFGRGVALAITGVLFGLVHWMNPDGSLTGSVSTGLAGVFLAIVYFKTGSLWMATGAHLGWNWALGFLADVPVSGFDVVETPLYDIELRGPEWLSGAGFGPEGSVLVSGVLVALCIGLWMAPWPTPTRAAVEAAPLLSPMAGAAGTPGATRRERTRGG